MGDLTRMVFRSGPGPDRNGFTTDMDGWDLTNFRANPVILFAHQDRQLPVGRAHTIGIVNDQMLGDVEFASHERARDIDRLVQDGFLIATSVGFLTLDFDFLFEEGHFFPTGIHSRKQELVEVSIVPIPADPGALKPTSALPGYAMTQQLSHLVAATGYQAHPSASHALSNAEGSGQALSHSPLSLPKGQLIRQLTNIHQLLRST